MSSREWFFSDNSSLYKLGPLFFIGPFCLSFYLSFFLMMTPIYLNPPTSSFPFVDLKDEHDHHPVQLFVAPQHHHQHDHKVYEHIWHGESSDHSGHSSRNGSEVFGFKKEDGDDVNTSGNDNGSVNWMSSSKMRRMMNSNCSNNDHGADHRQLGNGEKIINEYSMDNYKGNNSNTIRVCSDCNTSKTPLWRSGPRGPKSLCNACGIRQRKARRAMEVTAANGGLPIEVGGEASLSSTCTKSHIKIINKEKKSRTSYKLTQHKKKTTPCKVEDVILSNPQSSNNKRLEFEEFAMNLLKKHSDFQRVFSQDEEEGAILLMALSYGLDQS